MPGLKKTWENVTSGSLGWVIYIALGILLAILLNNGLGLAFSTEYPVVTVKSRSMDPTLKVGDMVFVYGRGEYDVGDIIVFEGWRKTPIIHRVVAKATRFENGSVEVRTQDGFDDVTEGSLREAAEAELRNEDSGSIYLTKGDNNPICDQCPGSNRPIVRNKDIHGRKVLRLPYLGWVKLGLLRVIGGIF